MICYASCIIHISSSSCIWLLAQRSTTSTKLILMFHSYFYEASAYWPVRESKGIFAQWWASELCRSVPTVRNRKLIWEKRNCNLQWVKVNVHAIRLASGIRLASDGECLVQVSDGDQQTLVFAATNPFLLVQCSMQLQFLWLLYFEIPYARCGKRHWLRSACAGVSNWHVCWTTRGVWASDK